MTNIEKNVEIARMLGWTYITWQEVKSEVHSKSIRAGWYRKVPKILNRKVNWRLYAGRGNNDLKFDIDANWQFEAIDWIEKQGYAFEYCNNQSRIYDKDLMWFQRKRLCPTVGDSPKEAIFEALFQFSQYLKQNK